MSKVITCPQCGKQFLYNPQSIFYVIHKGKRVKLCGYNCKNAYKRDNNIKEVNKTA